MTRIPTDDELWKRFISYIDMEGDCWLWKAATNHNGYGVFNWRRKIRRASNLMYEFVYGDIPSGKIVMHTCDVRECVRPLHLVLGTHKENIAQRDERGRRRNQFEPKLTNYCTVYK